MSPRVGQAAYKCATWNLPMTEDEKRHRDAGCIVYRQCDDKCGTCKACKTFAKVARQIDVTKQSEWSKRVPAKQWIDR